MAVRLWHLTEHYRSGLLSARESWKPRTLDEVLSRLARRGQESKRSQPRVIYVSTFGLDVTPPSMRIRRSGPGRQRVTMVNLVVPKLSCMAVEDICGTYLLACRGLA